MTSTLETAPIQEDHTPQPEHDHDYPPQLVNAIAELTVMGAKGIPSEDEMLHAPEGMTWQSQPDEGPAWKVIKQANDSFVVQA